MTPPRPGGPLLDFGHLAAAALTDTGRIRLLNEDAVLCRPEWGVFAVSDGMGGAEGGRESSAFITRALEDGFAHPAVPAALRSFAYRLLVATQAINQAGRQIKAFAAERHFAGTGATVVALLFDQRGSGQAALLHAGDSLAYRLRGTRMNRLVAPHSLAALYGTPPENLPNALRHVITRSVGQADQTPLEPTRADVQSGDTFLLCSDGLSGMLSEQRMAELLWGTARTSPATTASRLIHEANAAGGPDNISAVVIHCA